MKAWMMAMVSALVAANAWAGDAGRDAAAKICDGLFGQEEKLKCVKVVGAAKYFDEGAVKICGNLFGQEEKIQCLAACADKKYLAATVKTCSNFFGPEEKIKCLKEGGQKTGGGEELSKDEREDTILDIDRVIRNLERDEVSTAIRRLKTLRDRLEKKNEK